MIREHEKHARAFARVAACTALIWVAALPGVAQVADSDDLTSLSLSQLTKMEVSSVARRDQQLYKTPSAVFVITQDDIRRSGAEDIPEVLRMVPGIQVAQVEANKWAVSSRGFNSTVANKMLVMIDGRTIYNIAWSGTYWDMNEILLTDIDKIEVIRGPGATMWGANAVNGVINIITKKSSKTLGTQVVATEGNMARGASIRYGAERGDDLQYRMFFKYQRQPSLVWADGSSANDSGETMRGGGRMDWEPSKRDSFALHGDIYRGREDQQEFSQDVMAFQDKSSNSGGYALAHWQHKLDGADFALQVYYDGQNRKEVLADGRLSSTDFDFQYHITNLSRNDLTWGLGARIDRDHFPGVNIPFMHARHEVDLFSSFVQDEFSAVPNKLVLIAGTKLQWNTYTHIEVEPGVRLLWTPDDHHSVWTAVSRSVRTPSTRDRDLDLLLPLPPQQGIPIASELVGNPAFVSEVALSYELGYREKIGKRVFADLAGYVNHFDKLESMADGTPYMVFSPSPEVIIPLEFTNQSSDSTQGVEGTITWTPMRSFRLSSSYAWLQDQPSPSTQTVQPAQSWSTPRNTVQAHAAWDFARHWTTDASVYSASQTPIDAMEQPLTSVPAYERLDASVSYSLGESMTFKVGGRNLQEARHLEFNPQDNYTFPSEVPRSFYVKANWSF